MDIWSPEQYASYSDHRQRPFYELLGRVGAESPEAVVDLGCGTGELTAVLTRRWPDAEIEGIDSSAAMIGEARKRQTSRLRFRLEDIAAWRPDKPHDVVISSAALQWVPDHLELLPRWVATLAPQGWLAFTVPGNFGAPSHAILREMCTSVMWTKDLRGAIRHDVVAEPGHYLDLLARHGCAADVWETTYQQVLTGPDAVLEWTKGTALRPVLAALPSRADREEFLSEYGKRLAEAYPERPYGTVFPFRRVFVVARRAA